MIDVEGDVETIWKISASKLSSLRESGVNRQYDIEIRHV